VNSMHLAAVGRLESHKQILEGSRCLITKVHEP
jgi:hypothetical protein